MASAMVPIRHEDSGKPRNTRTRGCSAPLPIPTDAWTDIEVDFIVNLPTSADGYTRIAMCIDRHSKEVILWATKDDLTAVRFAQEFTDNVVRRQGLPRLLRTDCDPVFISKVWAHVAQQLKIQHKLAAPYRHEQIGQAERANRHIEQVLRALCNGDEEWARRLAVAELTINTTPTSTIGLAPFEIVHGWLPRIKDSDDIAMPTDGEDLSLHMRRVQEYVTQQLIEAGDRSIRDDGRDFTPQVGDRVYLSTDNLSNRLVGSEDSRLRDRFIGPFIVLKREATGVHIEVPYDWHIRQPIAIHRLRPCRDRSLPPVSVEYDEAGELQVVHEVEDVVGHTATGRGRRACAREFCVRWKGYGTEYDTMIPDLELAKTAPQLLLRYITTENLRVSRATLRELETYTPPEEM